MMIFTLSTSLINPMYGMTEEAIAEEQEEMTGTGNWAVVCCGPSCTLNGERVDYCMGDGRFNCCK